MPARVLGLVAVVVLGLGTPLGCTPAPLAPDPGHRLTGTYTFTATMSASCPRRAGPWTFRADIEIDPDGKNYTVKLYGGNFVPFLSSTFYDTFRGQDNPDGVLFFAKGGNTDETLFYEQGAGYWGAGTARGQFREGRIDAVFNGVAHFQELVPGCLAADHAWTFVR